jgi:hypothetical protein
MTRRTTAALAALVLAGSLTLIGLQPRGAAADTSTGTGAQELSLLTETPEAGFALAVTLSRRGVTATQPDREVLHALRPGYASDAESLIAASQVIAIHFQTVAAANDYWRE